MLRPICTLILTAISFTALRADSQFSLSAGGGPAFPVRGVKGILRTGFGGTGTLEFSLNDNISLLVRSGYYRWQFDNRRINGSVVAGGGTGGFDIAGPFQAIPATIGARITFDGALVRPYAGISGGACFLRWRMTGSASAPGAPYPEGSFSNAWTEPAISVDAGLRIVLSQNVSIDISGIYTAYSNSNDDVEPSGFLGMKVVGVNTATFVGVEAGVRLGF